VCSFVVSSPLISLLGVAAASEVSIP